MIRTLLDYCKIADEKVIDVFQSSENIPVKAIALFSHVLNAQHIWASRILQRKSAFSVAHVHLVNDFESVHKQNFELFNAVLDKIPLQEKVSYTNSSGGSYISDVRDILFHVVNHSTYHRGQIAMLFRDSEIEPPVTDYIFLKRDLQL